MALDDSIAMEPGDDIDPTEMVERAANGLPLIAAPVKPQPLYRVYEGSRIAVSKQVGQYWRKVKDAAIVAHDEFAQLWQLAFQYYNFHHNKSLDTPRGLFQRGDGTENIVFANLNIMLPAIYSKNPDVTVSTVDSQDEPFAECLGALLNTMFRRTDLLNAKPKIKKAAGMTLLTNFGILKIDWTKKDDSRELVIEEMQRISDAMRDAKDQEEVDALYGQLEALEQQMEMSEPSGPSMGTVNPKNLILDPGAENPDGTDGDWMMERCWLPTAALNERFTKTNPESEDDEYVDRADRVLVYKPTHKAVFATGAGGNKDAGLGMVLDAMDGSGQVVDADMPQERLAYLNQYFTECYKVWDRRSKRVFLFHRDDWTWPIWVWDDPLNITRFFPYFILGFCMSTGGTLTAGEVAYMLDKQDEVNDMNRQLAKIRRTVYDHHFYDADAINPEDAAIISDALKGNTARTKHLTGVRLEGRKIEDIFRSLVPPSFEQEKLFDKPAVLDTVNRIMNISDAIRGVQFKTNTNVEAVNTYQESMRLSVGAKVDVVEDVVSDVAVSLAELAIQNWDQTVVSGYVGAELGKAWKNMTLQTFNANYNVAIVAGSMEKPNSVFKKKEAIDVAQAIGQFAQAAPGATLRIMLRVLSQAFTDVVIKKEDWAAMDQEIMATMQKGVSTEGGGGAGDGASIIEQAKTLPPEVQQQVMAMDQQGAPPEQIAEFIRQQVATNGQQGQQPRR